MSSHSPLPPTPPAPGGGGLSDSSVFTKHLPSSLAFPQLAECPNARDLGSSAGTGVAQQADECPQSPVSSWDLSR